MNKFILSIFLCLSIFVRVNSFASEGKINDIENITQLLEKLNSYITTISYNYKIIKEEELQSIKGLSMPEALEYIDTLMQKALEAADLRIDILRSLFEVHEDLVDSFQWMEQKISSLGAERDFLRKKVLTIQDTETLKNLAIQPEDLSDFPVFKIRVFSTKRLGAAKFRKDLIRYFKNTYPSKTKPEMIQWLENLTLEELLIIFNNHLEQEFFRTSFRTYFVTNEKFYNFFRKVGVPDDIFIKMVLINWDYWDYVHIESLKKIFNSELYEKILTFMLDTVIVWNIDTNKKYRKYENKDSVSAEVFAKSHLLDLLSNPKAYSFFTEEERLNIRLFLAAIENDGKRLTSKQIFESIPHIGEAPKIFGSVQSFAHQEELTEIQHINQLLNGLYGYISTFDYSFEPVQSYQLQRIKTLAINKILEQIDFLMDQAFQAERLQELILKSFTGVHRDLQSSLQRKIEEVYSIAKEIDHFENVLIQQAEAKASSNSYIKFEDLSDLPIFKTRVLDTPKKYLNQNIIDSLKRHFKRSHPFTQDPEFSSVSLGTLTIKQLMLIINKYLIDTDPLQYSAEFHDYLIQVGVPQELLIKMALNTRNDIQLISLKTIFSSILYNKFLRFFEKYPDRFPNTEYQCIWLKDLQMLPESSEFKSFFIHEERIPIKLLIESAFNKGEKLSTQKLFEAIPRIR